jgi:Uma2 family endonuclease
MSAAIIQDHIEYPESDGKPMGETDLHRDWMIRILEIFRQRYAGQRVYIASDLLVYYLEGTPTKFVVPDCFLVLDCDPQRRRIFQTWKEHRVPNVVIEVTSRGTSMTDIVDKPVIYERIGVQEYFLYDPTAAYLTPSLQGYRLIDGFLREIPNTDGRLRSETLDVDLFLRDQDLVIVDSETGIEQLTKADAEELARQQAVCEKEQEHAARVAAESRIRELEEEIRRLRNNIP